MQTTTFKGFRQRHNAVSRFGLEFAWITLICCAITQKNEFVADAAMSSSIKMEANEILSKLMDGYNSDYRPIGINGTGPTLVSVNMYVRQVNKLDINAMKFGVQLTFRMQWIDPRLRYETESDDVSYITVPASKTNRLWKPDLFFSNERESNFHDILARNEYFRVFPNGEILYSTRITLGLHCPGILKWYPFDKQACTIRMASYGFTTNDLKFMWKSDNPIQITSDLHLRGFSIWQFTYDHCDSITPTGTYSCIRADFFFKREYSIVIKQWFIHTAIAVLITWLSSWLHPVKSATPRVIILIACAFYTSTLTAESVKQIDGIGYETMMNRWNWCIWIFLIVALVEFIAANYLANGMDESTTSNVNPNPSDLRNTANCWGDILGKLRLKHVFEKMVGNHYCCYQIMEIIYRTLFICAFALFLINYKGKLDIVRETVPDDELKSF